MAGRGPSFCAGGDFHQFLELHERGDNPVDFLADVSARFSLIAASPKPWGAVVHGHAVAGGLELALACDVVVAADTTLIGDGHLNRRLVPAGRIKRPVSRCGRTRTSEAMILWPMTMVMTRRLGRRRRRTGPAPARVPIPARRAA